MAISTRKPRPRYFLDRRECFQPVSSKPESAPPSVVEGVDSQSVSFAPGANSAFVEGSITGYENDDYVLNVRKGPPMNISMATQHTGTYFNLLEPGDSVFAINIGVYHEQSI